MVHRPVGKPVCPGWGRLMYVPASFKFHFPRVTLSIALAISVSFLWVGVAYGQNPDPGSADPRIPAYDQEEAQSIDGMLMCPVCPAETIGQAQVEISRQMRRLVRENHPDALVARGLPLEAIKMAEKRMFDINRAWETISGKHA